MPVKVGTINRAHVRTARLEAGWTVYQLAAFVNVKASTISRIESGKTIRPHPSTVRNLVAVLGERILRGRHIDHRRKLV